MNNNTNSKKNSPLIIRNEIFKNETELTQYLEWNALVGITFINCTFEKLNLVGIIFASCDFDDCKFKSLNFRKCQFLNCNFENCQIINSDLTRAEFSDGYFKNLKFIRSNLRASDFRRYDFIKTTFNNSNLDIIFVRDIECWKSNESIQIKKSSNFADILKDLDLIVFDEEE